MKRVVITGMGVVSPVGNTIEDFWNSLKAGKHGFSFVNDVTGDDFDVKIAARVNDFSCDLNFKIVSQKRSPPNGQIHTVLGDSGNGRYGGQRFGFQGR